MKSSSPPPSRVQSGTCPKHRCGQKMEPEPTTLTSSCSGSGSDLFGSGARRWGVGWGDRDEGHLKVQHLELNLQLPSLPETGWREHGLLRPHEKFTAWIPAAQPRPVKSTWPRFLILRSEQIYSPTQTHLRLTPLLRSCQGEARNRSSGRQGSLVRDWGEWVKGPWGGVLRMYSAWFSM